MLPDDRREHVRRADSEGTDDAQVIAKAAMVLLSKPEHQSIEIWDGKRMEARVPRQPDFSNDQ